MKATGKSLLTLGGLLLAIELIVPALMRAGGPGDTFCIDPANQPNITFTLTGPSDGIYPGDSATLRWDVRSRDGRRRNQPIYLRTDPADLRSSLSLPPELLRENPGSYAITGSRRVPATIRLETRCGNQEVAYTPVPTPQLDNLSPGSAGAGERVHLRGRNFGSAGEVQLVLGEARMTMPVRSWGPTDVEVTVPTDVPVGNGYIHLFKGRGRLRSNSMGFRIEPNVVLSREFTGIDFVGNPLSAILAAPIRSREFTGIDFIGNAVSLPPIRSREFTGIDFVGTPSGRR